MSGTTAKPKSHGHELHEFVVTTFASRPGPSPEGQGEKRPQVLHSEIWHSQRPLGLGHPFRWVLEKTEGGLRIRKLGAGIDRIIDEPFQEIGLADLFREEPIQLAGPKGKTSKGPGIWITIRPVLDLKQIAEEAATTSWRPTAISADLMTELDGKTAFRNSSLSVLIFLLVAGVVIWRVPTEKPNPQELIPPQFAKVLLSPALKSQSHEQGRASSGSKGAQYNVVQAFQSEAVQKTTRSLLSVGAAKALLSKSTLLDAAASKTLVRKVFDSKSALKPMGKVDIRGLANKMAKVDLMGGRGAGRGNGAGSYGGSTGVALTGQGNSLVGISTEGLGVDEGLTKDEVGKVIREHLSEVRYCYESAMLRNPGLEAKLVVAFTIRGSGLVKTAQAKETSGDAGLDSCILARLVKWKFPKPRGGVDVGVTYPFIFKSLGD